MKNVFTRLVILLAVALISTGCGTTVYRGKVYKSKKYIGYKSHWYRWHAHYYKPRAHAGGYWQP